MPLPVVFTAAVGDCYSFLSLLAPLCFISGHKGVLKAPPGRPPCPLCCYYHITLDYKVKVHINHDSLSSLAVSHPPTGQVNLQGKNADGSNWTASAVAIGGLIPAPGAIALLGLAGITARRRRK